MKHIFSLKFKLIFFTLFITTMAMLTIGLISDKYLINYLHKDAKQKLYEAFSNTSEELKNIEKGLIESLYFIAENDSIIASLNLIKNYEDINNYNHNIFDEEKKRIINILTLEGKYSASDHIAIYNTNRQLVAYVARGERTHVIGFVSYQNGKPVYNSKKDKNEYSISSKPEYIEIELEDSFNNNTFSTKNSSVIYEKRNNRLNLKSEQRIIRKYSQSKSETIGYIQTSRNLSIIELNSLTKNVSLNYYFRNDMPKDFTQLKKSPLLFSEYNPSELYLDSDKNHFFSGVLLALEDNSLLLTAHIDKTELLQALTQSRKILIITVLTIIVGVILITLILLNKMISIPLKKLLNGIDIISKGNYQHTISINSNDELGVISKQFNSMAKKIDKRESELDELAHIDVLTQVPNRTMFLESLEHAIGRASRNKSKLAIYFLDLDSFKTINDILGHDVGDKVLVEIAKNVSKALRKNDLLARIGGDEFNIFIEDLSSPIMAKDIAEKIIEQLKLPITITSNQLNITGSIGIAIYPDDGEDITTLLKHADLAMYDAKDKGRNQYRFFSHELSIKLEKRTLILNELKEAIAKDELKLFYQPKFSLKDGTIYSAEALIRWESPTLGFVTPDQFIPLAEESGEIVKIGEWVIQQACRDFVSWKQLGLQINKISVNVSNVQFAQDDIIKVLKKSIQDSGIAAGALELEITESYIHENSDHALEVLHNIRGLGIDLAIDDFGTGYSSISYLKKLPINRLKIDKSFIDEIPYNSDDVEITKIIVALAKVMNLAITAEGIETQEQMNFLKDLECDEGQGYLCSKPLPNEKFIEFLKSGVKRGNYILK